MHLVCIMDAYIYWLDTMAQESFMSTSIYVLSRNDSRQLETFRQLAPEGVEVKWVDVTLPIDQQAAQLHEARRSLPSPLPSLSS